MVFLRFLRQCSLIVAESSVSSPKQFELRRKKGLPELVPYLPPLAPLRPLSIVEFRSLELFEFAYVVFVPAYWYPFLEFLAGPFSSPVACIIRLKAEFLLLIAWLLLFLVGYPAFLVVCGPFIAILILSVLP